MKTSMYAAIKELTEHKHKLLILLKGQERLIINLTGERLTENIMIKALYLLFTVEEIC